MSQKVIDRIEQLLKRTTENGATQAEAEQAVAYAQKLMDKHNLELADVVASGEEKLGMDDVSEVDAQFKAKFESFEKSLIHTAVSYTHLTLPTILLV